MSFAPKLGVGHQDAPNIYAGAGRAGLQYDDTAFEPSPRQRQSSSEAETGVLDMSCLQDGESFSCMGNVVALTYGFERRTTAAQKDSSLK